MDALLPFARRRTICLPRSVLVGDGVTVRQLAAAVRSGRLLRPRRGWYVRPDAPPPVAQAVRVGGRATCITALRTYDIWVPLGEEPHVAVPPTASRLRAPQDQNRPLAPGDERGASLHWRPWNHRHPELWRVSFEDALTHAAWCVETDDLVAILESALHQRRLGAGGVDRVRARSPRERRLLFSALDARSESGTETLVRRALVKAGLPVRPQVEVPGVGRVDLVVGDRVVVEVDSAAWHDNVDARARDYRRDLELFRRGYVVVRVSWAQAMFRREDVVAAVIAASRAVRRR